MSNIVTLPAINIKALGFSAKEIRKLVEGSKGAVIIAKVGGIAGSFFTGESKFGDWVGFKGDFVAVKHTGEVFKSKTCFLPSTIANGLRERLTNGEAEVEITAEISIVESDKNASGYAYLCEPVMSESADKRVAEIESRLIAKTQARLAAPSKKAASA